MAKLWAIFQLFLANKSQRRRALASARPRCGNLKVAENRRRRLNIMWFDVAFKRFAKADLKKTAKIATRSALPLCPNWLQPDALFTKKLPTKVRIRDQSSVLRRRACGRVGCSGAVRLAMSNNC